MTNAKTMAIGMILGGAVGIAYGGFSSSPPTREAEAEMAPLEFEVKQVDRVELPELLMAGAIGGGMLVLAFERGMDRRVRQADVIALLPGRSVPKRHG